MSSMAPPGGASELIGIAIALLVLILTFGSLVAAGLPILTAIFGVALGMTGITAMTAFMDIGSSTPMLATMIGLAVGIDYALFILARYRSELDHTDDREEAVGISVGTAGSAVVFAGLTVLIALPRSRSSASRSSPRWASRPPPTVLVAVLVALTLLPAMLGLMKSKAFGGRVRKLPARAATSTAGSATTASAGPGSSAERPVAPVVLVVVGARRARLPLKDLHLAFPTDSTSSTDTTQRKASDLDLRGVRPRPRGPAAGRRRRPRPRPPTTAPRRTARWRRGRPARTTSQRAGRRRSTRHGTGAQVLVTPKPGRTTPRRRTCSPRCATASGASRTQTGTDHRRHRPDRDHDRRVRAAQQRAADLPGHRHRAGVHPADDRVPLDPGAADRDPRLPALACSPPSARRSRCSRRAPSGSCEGQPIVSFMPIFLIGVVFGLAMDYQVFLVTRMREAHVHGMSHRARPSSTGSATAPASSTAAAAIMTAVFAAFMLQDEPIVKSMGFALAAAVVFDAFIVRMALIPALLYLLGEKAWWLPRGSTGSCRTSTSRASRWSGTRSR